jgi:subtilase family serine protease
MAATLTGCGGNSGGLAQVSLLNGTVSDQTVSSLDMNVLSGTDVAIMATPFSSSAAVAQPSFDSAATPLAAAAAPRIGPLVYTPAQIRTAYQLPSLPASWSNLSAADMAKMGAGQTIYIVDAFHDPNVVSELAAFNQRFGLPACTTVPISTSATLPLPVAKPADGCQFSVVYAQGSAMTATPPVYDAGWASEIALDVQWAHATAPLARIILIEAANASVNSLMGAINLANAMGPGIVSMSFGANEGSWMASVDSIFSAANMTYVAATGDSGAGVSWPSASNRVLAVGGTTLSTYTATSRTETVWSLTGGGVSKYVAVPTYQTASVPGMGNQTLRNVADVAFNADPQTGQYVAILAPGSSAVQWYSVGGTSLATPQWAGVIAVTNATRAQNGQGPLGLVQNFVYKAAISTANFFTSIFTDITTGSNGGYGARTYYDQPTGLGSPNASNFIALAAGGAAQPQTAGTSPTVSPITINGVTGTALSFSMAYTSPDPVKWALTGAPAGMTVDASGVIAWATPVAGNYQVGVMATDSVTQLSGSATATVVISAPVTPVVTSATVLGQVGRALTYQVNVQSNNPVAWTLTGSVPAGMAISSNGVLSWSSPVAGNYSVTVKAADATTSAVGSGVITLQISSDAATGPVITAPALMGTAGSPLRGVITVSDPTARSISISIAGAPVGMGFGVSGQDLILNWARPVVGTYNLRITATNNNRVSTQATLVIQVK